MGCHHHNLVMVVEWCCPLLALVAGTGCTDLFRYSIIWICHACEVPGGLYTVEKIIIIIIIIIINIDVVIVVVVAAVNILAP